MWVPFDTLPDEARLWIYPASRKLTEDEQVQISNTLRAFVDQWEAHGQPLEASFELRHDRFIILAVNQAYRPASGCSIDASVRVIQDIEQTYDIVLLDKMNVTFRTGGFLAHKSLTEFKQMAKTKAVNADTLVFNNLINTKGELDTDWEVPAADSWHSRFF